MNLYQISYSDWEDFQPHLFLSLSPLTASEWHDVCDRAIERAARQRLEIEDSRSEEERMWICWSDLVDRAVQILAADGFILVRPIGSDYNGGVVGGYNGKPEHGDQKRLSNEVFAGIVRSNKTANDQMFARHEFSDSAEPCPTQS